MLQTAAAYVYMLAARDPKAAVSCVAAHITMKQRETVTNPLPSARRQRRGAGKLWAKNELKKTPRKTIENKQREKTVLFSVSTEHNTIMTLLLLFFSPPRTDDRSRSRRYPPAGTDTRGVDRRLTRYDDERAASIICHYYRSHSGLCPTFGRRHI